MCPLLRLRECLSDLDPINSALQWASPIRRRVYSVTYPNALWHIDGNHKLIRYVEQVASYGYLFCWHNNSCIGGD